MSKYIKHDDIMNMLDDLSTYEFDTWDNGWNQAIKQVIEDLKEMPVADVQEVVRCKDCEYHGSCSVEFEGRFKLDSFCCLGKRKDCEE